MAALDPLDLQGLAARPHDPRFARGVHQVVRRYCRAHVGRAGRDFGPADRLADEVAGAILRERRAELAGPLPVEAVIYAGMAQAVARAVRERSEPAPRSEPMSPEHVHERLDRLPARSREVLVLRAFVGLTSEQVARALGLSPDAVRQEQRRARTCLRSP